MNKLSRRLSSARKVSLKAISQFTSTEEMLKRQNEDIAKTLDQAELEIRKLQELKENGLRMHHENLGIIDRIGQIVRGTDFDNKEETE